MYRFSKNVLKFIPDWWVQYDIIIRSIPHIVIMIRVFTNGMGDLGSIPGQVIPKIQKMVLDATWLNSQHYKVKIKGKMDQSRERSSILPYTFV